MSKTNNDDIKVLISKAELISFAQSMIFTFSECMLKYGNSDTEYTENEASAFADDLSLQVKVLIEESFTSKINEEVPN